MFSFFNDIFSWLPWVGIGGLGVAGVFSYLLGIPQALSIASNLLTIITPALQGVVQFFVWVAKEALQGALAVFTNVAAIVFAIILCLVSAGLTYDFVKMDVTACNDRLDLTAKQLVKYRDAYNAVSH